MSESTFQPHFFQDISTHHNCFLPFQLNQEKQQQHHHHHHQQHHNHIQQPLHQYWSYSGSDSSRLRVKPTSLPSHAINTNLLPEPIMFTTMGSHYLNYDYQTDCDIICVIDFEATCDNYGGRRAPNDAIMEIIEFPAFMIDTKSRTVIDTFHEYVRPVINPKLSHFCTQLTGISQHMVDQADIFPKVLERFERRIAGLLREKDYRSFAIATDGPWDIAHFLARQCQIHGLEFPAYARRWINLKKVYAQCYQVLPICLDNMLTTLGIKFEGRRHSGYYDALHITRLLLKMLNDGAILTVNEMVSWDVVGRKCWGNMDCGYIPYNPMPAICL